jgi:hypothetical protein
MSILPASRREEAMITVKIDANVPWRVAQSAATRRIIGVCDPLNLCLEADTEDELRSLIPEALHLLMTDLFEDQELAQFLKEKGWHAMNLPARPDGDVQFDVPWHIIAEGTRRDTERRLS